MNQKKGSFSRQYPVLLAYSILLGLCGVYITRSYLMDDALITLRYSLNFARYGIPIWNQADFENPSMGYTSLLWMSLNALPALFTANKDILVLIARLFSFSFFTGIIVLFSREIFNLSIPAYAKFAIATLIFSNFGYGFHVNSAMETMLFSYFMLLAIRAYAAANYKKAYVWGILVFLSRPEGILLIVLLCIWDLFHRRIQQAFLGGGFFALLLTGFLLLLYYWYGGILPNTFYVKQNGFNVSALRYSLFFLITLAFPFVITATHSAFFIKNNASRYMLATAVVYIFYYMTVSPLMNVLSRYQWSSLVALSYASVPTFGVLAAETTKRKISAVLLLASLVVLNLGNDMAAKYFADSEGHAMNNLMAIGKTMSKHREENKWLMYHDAGAICYFSDWNTRETIGLTNKSIATGQIELFELYQDPHTEIILQNFDLTRASQQNAKDKLTRQLSAYGYTHFRDIPILLAPGQRNFVVAVYARDVNFAEKVFADLKAPGLFQPSWFYSIFRAAGKLVKGQ